MSPAAASRLETYAHEARVRSKEMYDPSASGRWPRTEWHEAPPMRKIQEHALLAHQRALKAGWRAGETEGRSKGIKVKT